MNQYLFKLCGQSRSCKIDFLTKQKIIINLLKYFKINNETFEVPWNFKFIIFNIVIVHHIKKACQMTWSTFVEPHSTSMTYET